MSVIEMHLEIDANHRIQGYEYKCCVKKNKKQRTLLYFLQSSADFVWMLKMLQKQILKGRK